MQFRTCPMCRWRQISTTAEICLTCRKRCAEAVKQIADHKRRKQEAAIANS